MNTEFLLWILKIKEFSFVYSDTFFAFPSDDINEDYQRYLVGYDENGFPLYSFDSAIDSKFLFDFNVHVAIGQSNVLDSFTVAFAVDYVIDGYGIKQVEKRYMQEWLMSYETFQSFKNIFEFTNYLVGNIFARPFYQYLRNMLEFLIIDNIEKEVKNEKK